MAKSIIVYGVKGGKTRFAQRIADHFGLKRAIYRNGGAPWHPQGYIYFIPRTESPIGTSDYARSFQSVADEINATISLTDWQSGPPPMVGEWNASCFHDPLVRRWWNGAFWSMNYQEDWPEKRRNADASIKATRGDTKTKILWRGLSSEPIKVTE